MVSIGQNLTFKAAQLNSTQKTVQTEENSTENNAVVNQASINESNVGNFVPLNQINTDSLLANNGAKIIKLEESSIEVNSHFEFDDPPDFSRTMGKKIYKHGDTIHYRVNGKEYNYTYKIVWIDDFTYVGFFETDTGKTIKDDVYKR